MAAPLGLFPRQSATLGLSFEDDDARAIIKRQPPARKSVVIAVDQNLPHLIFGEFLGNDLGRIIFNKLDPDADERLANRLLEALDIAPVVQAREIERKRQVWKTFDF